MVADSAYGGVHSHKTENEKDEEEEEDASQLLIDIIDWTYEPGKQNFKERTGVK